jgi:hypothetical protein
MDSVLLFGFLILLTLGAVDCIRRAFLEVLALERQQLLAKSMRKLRKPVQPWVTVLVTGAKDDVAFATTWHSLQKSYYHHFDIVKTYTSYQAAYRRSRKGKIVIVLKAGQTVDRAFIKRAVALEANAPSWWVDLPESAHPMNGLMDMSNAFHALFRLKHWARVKVYTSKKFKKTTHFSESYRETIPLVEVLLFAILLTGTIIGGAIGFLYAWLIFTLYVISLVWIGREGTMRERLTLTISSISALFILPVASLFMVSLKQTNRKV